MSLQFILGAAGSGKSTYLYRMIAKDAAEQTNQNFIVLVPDQFTLETQKTLVEQSGKNGILNIDVLSFHRLAYRVLEEVPALRKTVLEDMGKMMILRKVLAEQKENLEYFKRGLYKPGFLDECKSFLCELTQYAIGEEDFDKMEESLGGEGLMAWKMQDLRLIYRELKAKMGDTYMMAEELVPQLTSVAASIGMLQNSVICLDGFTGFTPTQYELLETLLTICDRMIVTVTTDRTEKRGNTFSISNDTITKLSKLAMASSVRIEEPIITGKGKDKAPYRLRDSNQLTFLEENIFSFGGKKWKEEVTDISLRACRKESDEAAYVAAKIWWLVKEEGYSYDDIAVVTGDIAAYEQHLSRELNRLGIRYFMDYKKSIGANALAEYLVSFMEMYRRGMDYESTFRFLRCGLSPLATEEVDVLENYVVARGRRGYRSYERSWEFAVEKMDLVLVNECRQKFMASIGDTWKKLQGGKKTVREFTEILYGFIVQNNLYEKIRKDSEDFEKKGKILLSKEYKSIYRLMMNLFDEMVELLGDERVAFREYEELLSAGISEGLVGFVPPTANQVMVGDVERSRLKNIKVLFFLGVNDDRIPKKKGGPGILSETERKRIESCGIELAPSPEKQAYTEEFYLYLTLTKPSQKLILTFSKMGSDGSSKRPAGLIHSIRQMFPKLSLEDDEKEKSVLHMLGTDQGRTYLISHLADGTFKQDMCWWELASYYQKKEPELIEKLLRIREETKGNLRLSKEAAQRLYGDEIYGNVSRLEQFAKCPYAHFIIYGLGLSEKEEYQVESFDYGNVFHHAMEHFSHILEVRGESWKEMKEEEIETLAEECVQHATDNYKGEMFYQSKRVEFIVRRMKSVMKTALWAVWKQMQQGEFVQVYSEKKFSSADGLDALCVPLEEDKKMIFGGQIDRIDICNTGEEHLVKIIDYKSGANDLSLSKVFHGLQMQLVMYMSAAMEMEEKKHPEKEAVPAAMLYYQMQEPELEWKSESETERKLRVLKEMTCKGYVNEEPEILEKLDSGIVKNGVLQSGKSSYVVPVSVNQKSDKYSSYSKVLSTAEFQKIMEHTRKKIEEFGNRIYEGDIEVAPYQMGTETGCDYCRLKGICGMEKKELKKQAKQYDKMKEDEVWEALYGRD